jgi:guanine nucleotide-binding protein G(I)/G(S)/G(T) subunit beta-1
MNSITKSMTTLAQIRGPPATKLRRQLKGHFGKVTAMHWAGDSQSVASASQDGKLLLWNALTTNKLKAIALKSPYVMTVGLEPTKGRLVASGGLDNLCTIYRWDSGEAIQELAHHDGFVSCCRFLGSEQEILTSSGDSTLIKWHVETGRVLDVLEGHTQDVMSFSLSTQDPNLVCSGSVDKTVKVWDLRDPKTAKMTFSGIHQNDINGVDFLHNMIGTASGDGTSHVLDMRAHGSVVSFSTDDSQEGLTSVSFSKSGRILFAGHSNSNVLAWDVLTGDLGFCLTGAHDKHVSSIGVNPKGDALCTASWDMTLKIWA